MAQRRASSGEEVSLFPFLSILACLIGALVLIIVVLVVAQAGKAEGRTPDEIRMAQDYQKMQRDIEERKKLDSALTEKLAELEKLQKDVDERVQRYIKLRRIINSSKEVQEQNREISMKLQKELDDLLVELEGMKRQQELTKEEIKVLMAELKERQVPPEKKVPPVVVQPSGSGMSEETKLYFVECSSGSLKVLGAWGEDYRLASSAGVVVGDVSYNHFLTEVAKDKNSLILFLIRDDGQSAYNTGAGRAQNDYNIRVGKLPIPGRGLLDLALFEKFRGKIPPPAKGAETPKAAPKS
jgi:hypothetical protein